MTDHEAGGTPDETTDQSATDGAAAAGSESPEEGQQAMKDAEDAVEN